MAYRRIAYMSDLHLEFYAEDRIGTAGPIKSPHTEAVMEQADVLVLAGDIHKGSQGIDWAAQTFPGVPTVYVLGNHEAYHRDWEETLAACRERAEAVGHVHVLENEAVTLAGVRFLGCALWTDFAANGTPELSKRTVWHGMNDYRQIKVQGRRILPEDTEAWHHESRAWLADRLTEGPAVVVTHHGPHMDTQPPQYRYGQLAPGFTSDLSALFGSNAPLWICGHTHYCCDFEESGTRIVSNQAGYPGEEVASFDPIQVVEIEVPG